MIAVYAKWNFAAIEGIGWGWAGVIWLYNIVFYIPLDFIKLFIRYASSGRAWDLVFDQRVSKTLTNQVTPAPLTGYLNYVSLLQVAFTRKRNFGKEDRELKWAQAQRTLHGLDPPEIHNVDRNNYNELNQMAEDAKRRAEMTRYTFLFCILYTYTCII